MSENTPPSAFNPMPPVIVALFAVIAGLELVFSLGTLGLFGGADASSWRFWLLSDMVLIQAYFLGCLKISIIQSNICCAL